MPFIFIYVYTKGGNSGKREKIESRVDRYFLNTVTMN